MPHLWKRQVARKTLMCPRGIDFVEQMCFARSRTEHDAQAQARKPMRDLRPPVWRPLLEHTARARMNHAVRLGGSIECIRRRRGPIGGTVARRRRAVDQARD